MQTLEKIKIIGCMSGEKCKKLEKFLDGYSPWEKMVEQSYTHGDLHMENVLVTEN